MKLLVGVMYCIENEFEQCISSIKSQSYTDYSYFTVEKLPNKEAHEKLYRTFMSATEEYDLFVKLDADMVLTRESFFEEIVRYFTANSDVDDLQIAVHDFFTNRLIYGLHVYSNRMKWDTNDEKIFVDWPTLKPSCKRVNDSTCLAPAAWHCPNPSDFQAFHFGVHKAVKITQYERSEVMYEATFIHWKNLTELSQNFQRTGSISLAFSILGAFEAIRNRMTSSEVNFDNPKTFLLFEKWQSSSKEELLKTATSISQKAFIFPSILMVTGILLYGNKSHAFFLAKEWLFRRIGVK